MARFFPFVLIAVAISVVLSRIAPAGRLADVRAALEERRETVLADRARCVEGAAVPGGAA